MWLKLSSSFQMPDRCFSWICVAWTQLVKALCKPLRYGDIAMLLLCLLCVMDVLWICCECGMNVSLMCYEFVMDVLWICYGCVMNELWMCEECYGCIEDVLGMRLGCIRDGRMIDILYLLYKLYCKWYCNCDTTVVLWYNGYVNLCILFFRVF